MKTASLQRLAFGEPRPPVPSTDRRLLQRKCACGGDVGAGGQCEECRKKKLLRKARENDAPVEAPQSVDGVLRSTGAPLPAEVRAFMEPRFGHDFSRVRVHSDAAGASSAREVNALAYTVGDHIVFDHGKYKPRSRVGGELLAHELTHVVQQRGGDSDDALEREAARIESAIVSDFAAEPIAAHVAAPSVQRACGEAAIGEQQDCAVPPDAGFFIPGQIFRFKVSCDEFKSGEEASLAAYGMKLKEGETLEVHGFASEDGGELFNSNLACARAKKAIQVLNSPTGGGLSAGAVIGPINHGEVEGPVDDTRSVVIVWHAAPEGRGEEEKEKKKETAGSKDLRSGCHPVAYPPDGSE